MLKKIFSPEHLNLTFSHEQGRIRSKVHQRMLEHKHAIPAARSAFEYMFSNVSNDVQERMKDWAVNRNFLAGVQANIPQEYSREVHEQGLDIHGNYGENLVQWMDKDAPLPDGVAIPDNISTLESTPVMYIEPGIEAKSYTARSDEISRARDLVNRLSAAEVHAEFNKGSDAQTTLTLV